MCMHSTSPRRFIILYVVFTGNNAKTYTNYSSIRRNVSLQFHIYFVAQRCHERHRRFLPFDWFAFARKPDQKLFSSCKFVLGARMTRHLSFAALCQARSHSLAPFIRLYRCNTSLSIFTPNIPLCCASHYWLLYTRTFNKIRETRASSKVK